VCRKLGGGCRAPFLGELGPHVTRCGLAEAYLRTRWHLDPSSRLATTNMSRKLGAVPLLGCVIPMERNVVRDEAYLRAKFHVDASNRLATIHQCYSQTGQPARQTGQRFDSIGRNVLQTVAQKIAWVFYDS